MAIPSTPYKFGDFTPYSDEILLEILQWVDPLTLYAISWTSHKGRQLAGDGSLWKKYRTDYQTSQSDMSQIRRRVWESEYNKRCNAFIASQEVLDEKTLRKAATQFPKATSIQMTYRKEQIFDLPAKALELIADLFPRIVGLALKEPSGDYFEYKVITDADLSAFAHKTSARLKRIELANCPKVTESAYSALFQNCRGLASVALTTDAMSDQLVAQIVTLTALTHLKLSGNSPMITNETLHILGKNSLKLKSLALSITQGFEAPPVFSEEGVVGLLGRVKNLEQFDLIGCANISDLVVTTLANNSPGLRDLFCGQNITVTTAGLAAISDKCQNINQLSLMFVNEPLPLTTYIQEAKAKGKFRNLEFYSIAESIF